MLRLFRGSMVVITLAAAPALAQQAPQVPAGAPLPPFEAELAAGGGWFLDDEAIGHSLVGAAARWHLTPRLAVGPEWTYWRGPGQDRDLTLTGNVTFFLRRGGLTPFFVGGAGLFRHSDQFAGRVESSTEGGVTLGGGLRVPFAQGWYLAPEWRMGWEPHMRVHVAIGRRF